MIGKVNFRILCSFLLSLSLINCGGDEPSASYSPGELTIAAASSLRPVVDALAETWREKYPDTPIRASYGSSGVLYAQIDSAAPFDLFLSADDVYPRRLRSRDVADEPFHYATGTLVIWVPGANDPIRKLEDLSEARFEKIAVASPNLAPYGEAALEALEGIGIYDSLKRRLLFASNVSEAAHFAESGGADAALLPLSLVVGTDLHTRGTHIVVPESLHDSIIHDGAIISATPDREAAEAFVDLLLSNEGQEILSRFGFKPPPAPTSPDQIR